MVAPTPRKPERPVLWIVAGPNGSGKSTFYNRTDIEGWGGSVWIINPDLLTRAIVERERLSLEQANRLAVERVEQWLYASIAVYQTIRVETVLSTDKYRPLIETARAHGFQVRMIYVLLRSADLQTERVRRRVAEGGHDVPEDKIGARRVRSFEQLPGSFAMSTSVSSSTIRPANRSSSSTWRLPATCFFSDRCRAT
jgi:predicted ABC-type ATPase